MSEALLITGLTAFAVSVVVTVLTWRGGILDFPNARSSHSTPTPRGGGLGLMAGVGAGAIAASFLPLHADALAGVLGVSALFGFMGFVDDLITLDERIKLACFTGLCLAMTASTGAVGYLGLTPETGVHIPVWLGWLGSALFVFVVVNAVNFMDGSDGLLAAVMIPAGVGLAVAGLVAGAMTAVLCGVLLAAGLLGFVVLNWPPARIFAGDVGALGAGALYAGGALAMAGKGFSGSLWLAPLFVLIFLADVLLTLLRRARHGRFSLLPHREHAYQRLIDAGWSHQKTAGVYGGLTGLIVLSGLMAAQGPDGSVPVVLALWVVILSLLYALAGRGLK